MAESILTAVFLTVCSYTDIKKKLVSVKVIVLFFLIGALICLNSGNSALAVIMRLLPGVFFVILSKVSGGKIGEGDGMVLLVTGLYLGLIENVWLLCLALFLSAVFSVAVLILKKSGKNESFPFVPFMLAAFILLKLLS